eukprot:gnl/TRDRNA2_/TRDRNA2_93674_c0_seq1.p1 gnl/TRDRNA2_/TRDRNA2_93674_c0~~gnl/TRDRNA2_/TRDRNA2_93674_c0_seq1.p1  ORF type:complete len:184 (-),score=26.59 gnl/TRDRNA2_/TRDRNA2_93674_c0_seq1:33-584(-)
MASTGAAEAKERRRRRRAKSVTGLSPQEEVRRCAHTSSSETCRDDAGHTGATTTSKSRTSSSVSAQRRQKSRAALAVAKAGPTSRTSRRSLPPPPQQWDIEDDGRSTASATLIVKDFDLSVGVDRRPTLPSSSSLRTPSFQMPAVSACTRRLYSDQEFTSECLPSELCTEAATNISPTSSAAA